MLPGVTSRAFFWCMKECGAVFNILAIALSAITLRLLAFSGTISSKYTGTPALAICAAMPLPITPAPITATFSMFMTRPPISLQYLGHHRCTG